MKSIPVKHITLSQKISGDYLLTSSKELEVHIGDFIQNNLLTIRFEGMRHLAKMIVKVDHTKSFFSKINRILERYINIKTREINEFKEIELLKNILSFKKYWNERLIILSKIMHPLRVEMNAVYKGKKDLKDNDSFKHIFYRYFKLFLKSLNKEIYDILKILIKEDRSMMSIERNIIKEAFLVLKENGMFDALFIQISDEFNEFYISKINSLKQNNLLNQIENILKTERSKLYFEDDFYFIEKRFLNIYLNNHFPKEYLNFIFENKKDSELQISYNFYCTAGMKEELCLMLNEYILNSQNINCFYNFSFLKELCKYNLEKSFENDFYIKERLNGFLIGYVSKNETNLIKDTNEKIDKLLREEKSLEIAADAIGFIYANVSEKDDFERLYLFYLSNRLLTRRITSLEREYIILEGMKRYVSLHYIHRISVVLSEFEKKKLFSNAEVILMKMCKWPFFEDGNFRIPDELKKLQKSFETLNKKSKLKISWNNAISLCEVEINNINLLMTVFQYSLLSNIIETPKSLNDLKKNFEFKLFDDHFLPLKDKHIIVYKNFKFHFNYEFYSADLSINIVPAQFQRKLEISNEKDEITNANVSNNTANVDCLIIRLLKKNKNMEKKIIINECVKKTGCGIKFIEERLVALVDKEYLSIEKNMVKYIP